MMDTQQQYNKIQQFIKQHYLEFTNSGTVVVHNTNTGLRVGSYNIQHQNDQWIITNDRGTILHELRQRRLAILLAALLCKKKYQYAQLTAGIDQRYDIFSCDLNLYKQKLAQNPDNYTYKHRLIRVVDELDLLNSQINELEKSACLQ